MFYFIKSNTDFFPALCSAFSKASIAVSRLNLVLFVLACPYKIYNSSMFFINIFGCKVFLNKIVKGKECEKLNGC